MRAVRLLYALFPGGQQPVAQSQPAHISMRRQRELAHITGEHMAIPGFPIATVYICMLLTHSCAVLTDDRRHCNTLGIRVRCQDFIHGLQPIIISLFPG